MAVQTTGTVSPKQPFVSAAAIGRVGRFSADPLPAEVD
jgi:hypothetical protein